MRTEPMFPNHRWSGWPGAICHYCYQSDPVEEHLAGYGDGIEKDCPATLECKLAVDERMNPTKEGEIE